MRAANAVLLSLFCLIVTSNAQTTIVVTPSNATVSAGENFIIDCNSNTVGVVPRLNINGNPATNDQFEDATPPGAPAQRLVFRIPSLTPNDNGTMYSCTGGNDESTSVTLIVLFSPTINNPIMVTDGSVGDEATVTFMVNANPQVIENGISINGPGTADNVNINGNQVTVTFSNLMRSDAGDYVVTATNTEGSGNATFSLDVFFGPNFLQLSNTINKRIGENVTLNCSVESNPPANVTFITTANTTSNVAIKNQTQTVIIIIIITNAVMGNSGDYTCIADNGQNVNNQTFSVRIGNVPDIVLTYGMISYNMSHIVIPYTITTPNTIGSIQQYTVSCPNCPAGYTMISFASPLPNPAALPLNMITCGTTYTISINATNEFGSAVVASGSFTTDECVTPSPSTSPTGDSIGLVGTTTAVLVVLLGIIAAVFVN